MKSNIKVTLLFAFSLVLLTNALRNSKHSVESFSKLGKNLPNPRMANCA